MEASVKLTAVFEKVPEGYIGYVEEISGVNTQGDTLEEAKANLVEALQLVLDARRTLMERETSNRSVIKESIRVTA